MDRTLVLEEETQKSSVEYLAKEGTDYQTRGIDSSSNDLDSEQSKSTWAGCFRQYSSSSMSKLGSVQIPVCDSPVTGMIL